MRASWKALGWDSLADLRKSGDTRVAILGPASGKVTGEEVRTDVYRAFPVIVKTSAFTLSERGSHYGFVQKGAMV